MLVATIALATAILSALLVLSGLRMVLRDTAGVLLDALRDQDGRLRLLAFAGLWILIFWLTLA